MPHARAVDAYNILKTELIGTPDNKHIGRITAELEGSAEEVYTVITDFKNFESFMPNMRKASILKVTDTFAELEIEIKMPFPITNIQYIQHIDLFPDQYRTKFHMVQGSSKQAKQIYGHWVLTPQKENKTLAEYQVFFLPVQRYPSFIEEKATRISLKNLVKSVQNQVLLRRANP